LRASLVPDRLRPVPLQRRARRPDQPAATSSPTSSPTTARSSPWPRRRCSDGSGRGRWAGWRASLLGVTGCDGLPLTAVTWPALGFGQAAFALLYTALRTPPPAPSRAAFRAFVATSLLVWFAYFAYRPSEWSLSSYYLLYGFLVIDAARHLVREVFVRRRIDPLLAFG